MKKNKIVSEKPAKPVTKITAKVSIVAASLNTVTLSYVDTADSAYFEANRGITGTLTFNADKPAAVKK